MASAQATEVFNCSVDEFYKIISDYEKYPEFLPEVKNMRITEDQGARKKVEYTVNVIKNFKYSLWMSEKAPEKIEKIKNTINEVKKTSKEVKSEIKKETKNIKKEEKVFLNSVFKKGKK